MGNPSAIVEGITALVAELVYPVRVYCPLARVDVNRVAGSSTYVTLLGRVTVGNDL